MTPGDTARVLAKVQAYDRRTVGETDILAWHETIGDLDYADALAAVSRHYRESTQWLMPAHIVRGATEIADERRRANLRARADRELEQAPPVATEDRSAEVRALLAELRDTLPPVDPIKYRRAEVLDWERQRDRDRWAQPNPHYDPSAEGA